jgi:acyl-[acyl-carrier-protein] desaturase
MVRDLPEMPRSDTDQALLEGLGPLAEELLETRLQTAKEWLPHENVPWRLGRDFKRGEPWGPASFPLPGGIRSALYISALDADRAPHYYRSLGFRFGIDHPIAFLGNRYIAERIGHGIALSEWLTVTRAVDMSQLERDRITLLSKGRGPQLATVTDGLVYFALREGVSEILASNTAARLEDKHAKEIIQRISQDEAAYRSIFRSLTSKALEIEPSSVVVAAEQQITQFVPPQMSVHHIEGLEHLAEHSQGVITEDLYTDRQFQEQIILPDIRMWGLFEIEGINAEAEASRSRLHKYLMRQEPIVAE